MSDRHSTKLLEDAWKWASETTGQILNHTSTNPPAFNVDELEQKVRAISVPVLLIHGTGDRVVYHESSRVLQKMIPGSELVLLDGAGHIPNPRYPVKVNHLIKGFVDAVYGIQRVEPVWHVGAARPKKVLYISSPIGLGHARRDLAIAEEIRVANPDVQIDWLAQDPVTRVLEAGGERIHPASRHLASESSHIETESGEHDLNAFQAIRNMDEILTSNFMLFDEVVQDGQYDLVVGDETWELDYHLHENPNLKKTAYTWMTDFVGWLPMTSGGEREAYVAADYNAEMIRHISRYKRVRDKAIFVGNSDDIIDATFGPGLPAIRDWTEANYDFAGYVTGFDPAALGPKDEMRDELGYDPEEKVCIVTVGGSGVGASLIKRIVEGFPIVRRLAPELRMVVVTGPRIDPESLPQVAGVEYRSYVDRLYRHLAVADVCHRPRWPHHDDGAHRLEGSIHLRPTAQSLRAELPRSCSSRSLWGRAG